MIALLKSVFVSLKVLASESCKLKERKAENYSTNDDVYSYNKVVKEFEILSCVCLVKTCRRET